MNYELLISRRYLRANRKNAFLNIVTIISVGSVALGVAALIVVMGVMTGYREDLQKRILGVYSDIIIYADVYAQRYLDDVPSYREVMEKVEKIPDVVATTPFTYSQVMLSTSDGGVSGAILRGIEVETAPDVLDIEDYIVTGSLEEITRADGEYPGIILGSVLAETLETGYGDVIFMLSPGESYTSLGFSPKMRRFRVVGIFDSGMYDFDYSFAFIDLAAAQDFFDMGDTVYGIEVKVQDIYDAWNVSRKIETVLDMPFFWPLDWMKMNVDLLEALQMQKEVLSIILIMIVLVAAFNIVSTLIMMVMEKQKEIAILKSIGVSNGGIMRIFIYEGLIIGVLGTLIGVLSGLGLSFILGRSKIISLDPSIYYLSSLPVKIVGTDLLIIVLTSIFLCFLATLYPAWRASRMDPVEAMRYE
ncbi:MAG: lipoprotein-releasing ABC transporter permease subunit [Deltaproteobacteria bacterium]|nr:lipoprotein-releasing ABC transporter permease subunit [Candidatus Zymogenaceae bacterium]